jgi:hypothetical protein
MAVTTPPAYRTGIVGECKLASVLIQYGCRTALLQHGAQVAPVLRAWRGGVPLPRWQVRWPDGGLSWIAVRFKSTCGVMRSLAGLRTTGIDWADHKDYAEVERLTGKPVKVVLAHRTQNLVVVAGLHTHRVRAQGAGGGVVFWDFDRLPRLFSCREVEEAPAREHRIDEPLFFPPDLPPQPIDLFDGLVG